MKILNKSLFLAISTCLLISCSASKNASSDDSDDIRPRVKTPGQSIINASGDGLSPSINPLSGNRGTGANNAVNITNNAINNARLTAKEQSLKRDSLTDEDFLNKAALYIATEADISKVAQDKSDINDIKAYSKTLVSGQKPIQDDLQQLSSGLNIKLAAITHGDLKYPSFLADKNNPVNVNDFNFNYVQSMIEGQRNAIRLFETGAKSKNQQVVDFSNKYLPVIKARLSGAQDLTKFVSPAKKPKK